MKRPYPQFLFILILLGVSFYYNYHQILFKRPQSVHTWRQTDGASVALNYSREGMNFFQPSFHNLTSDGGTSGKSATSEMPLLYFTVAILYRLFGEHEFLYRLFNMLIFFLGLFYLFKIIRYEFKDIFWAISIPLFIFSSPVLAYYGNNFLPNTTAFSMVLIGWYYVFRYFRSQKKGDLQKIFFFFLLAGSLKVTALFSFFALAAIFLLEWSGMVHFNRKKKLFPNLELSAVSGLLMLIPIVAWILYAKYYNNLHDSTYFSTVLFPFWHLEPDAIRNILTEIKTLWLNEYFHPLSLIFLVTLLVFIIIFLRRNRKLFNLLLLFLFLEVIVYVMLQFWFFAAHDYYTINIYILPVIILLSSVSLLNSFKLPQKTTVIIKGLFAVFLVFNIYYAGQQIQDRNEGFHNNIYRDYEDFYTLEPHLRKMGLNPEDRVISFSDYSHVSLYLMDQKGWTRFIDMRLHRGEPIPYNNDSAAIQRSIDNGAKYLIINGLDEIYESSYLRPFTKYLESTYRNILIFNPRSEKENFNFREREKSLHVVCNAEHLNDNKTHFTDTTGLYIFSNPETQSDEYFLSGNYSVGLSGQNRYGMTFILKNVKYGESVKAIVWRKGVNSKGGILIQAEDFNQFNKYRAELTGNTSGEWVEIMIETFIPYSLNGQDIKVYIYQPEEEKVYFDDFEVIKYNTVFPN